jgi:hypothetical protein
MNLLLIAVLLTVMQTAPSAPRQASDDSDSTSQNITKKTTDNKATSEELRAIVEQVKPLPQEGASKTPESENTEHSVKILKLPSLSITKDWADRTYWIFSLFLVIVGGLQAWLLYQTRTVIREQADTMARQARSMRYQTTILRDSAVATNANAKAALLNAQAVINSERAWIDGEILHKKQLNIHAYSLHISNHGKTPAKLLSYEIRWGYEIEDQSIYSESLNSNGPETLNRLFGTSGSSRIGDWFRIDSMFSEEPETSEMETKILWTTILYQDVVGGNEVHKTTFVYRCRPLLDVLERRSVYDDYT